MTTRVPCTVHEVLEPDCEMCWEWASRPLVVGLTVKNWRALGDALNLLELVISSREVYAAAVRALGADAVAPVPNEAVCLQALEAARTELELPREQGDQVLHAIEDAALRRIESGVVHTAELLEDWAAALESPTEETRGRLRDEMRAWAGGMRGSVRHGRPWSHDDGLLRQAVRAFLEQWDKVGVGNPHYEIEALRRAVNEDNSRPRRIGESADMREWSERLIGEGGTDGT